MFTDIKYRQNIAQKSQLMRSINANALNGLENLKICKNNVILQYPFTPKSGHSPVLQAKILGFVIKVIIEIFIGFEMPVLQSSLI